MIVAQLWDGMAGDGGQLSLLSGLLLDLLDGLSTFHRSLPLWALVGLHVLIVHSEGLVNLGTKRRLIFNTRTMLAFTSMERERGDLQANKFRIIHFQKHTGDLSRKFWLHNLNLGEQCLAKKLLLLGWRSGSKLSLESTCALLGCAGNGRLSSLGSAAGTLRWEAASLARSAGHSTPSVVLLPISLRGHAWTRHTL